MKYGLLTISLLAATWLPAHAHAYYGTAFEAMIGVPLCKISWALEGTVGRIIASISIMASGLYALYTRQRWPFYAGVIIGLIVFSYASVISDKMAGPLLPGAGALDLIDLGLNEAFPEKDLSCAVAWVDKQRRVHITNDDTFLNQIHDKIRDMTNKKDEEVDESQQDITD